MEAILSSQNVYGNIDPNSLDQLFGLLEPVEGFGDDALTKHTTGPLYVIIQKGKPIPVIAYGMNRRHGWNFHRHDSGRAAERVVYACQYGRRGKRCDSPTQCVNC